MIPYFPYGLLLAISMAVLAGEVVGTAEVAAILEPVTQSSRSARHNTKALRWLELHEVQYTASGETSYITHGPQPRGGSGESTVA